MVNLLIQQNLKRLTMIRLFKKVIETLLLVFLCGGCHEHGSINSDDLPGIYASHYDGEYSKGEDTLLVSAVNDDTYAIERRSSFQRIRDEIMQPVQTNIVHWTTVYNEADKALHEQRQGIILYASDTALIWGNHSYHKIK